MPIKLPNRFSRRKSSGNALEELENPPEPSFRVFERPQGGSKSFDGGNKLNRFNEGRPLSSPGIEFTGPSFEDHRGKPSPTNRGSGGTNNSSSTVGYNDTSSSSARFSSSSTLPSSSGAPTPDESYFPRKQEPPYDIPVPPIPQSRTPAFSLRAAGRTFSFGSKASKALAPGPGQLQSSASEGYLGRERAMTTSSYASTATPPKLEADLDLHLDDSDLGGFGDMFKGFGTRKSALPDGSRGDVTNEPTVASPGNYPSSTPVVPSQPYPNPQMKSTPPPINVEHFHRRDIGSSPYSWGSQDSNKGLMASPSPPAVDRSVSQTNSPPVPRHAQFQASTMMSQPSTPSLINQLRSEQNGSYVSLPMSSTNAGGRSSIPFEDEDAKVVMKSVSANRATARQSTGDAESPNALMEGFRERNSMPTTDRQSPTSSGPRRQSSAALFDSDDSEFVQSSNGWAAESTQTTPRAKRSDLRRESTEQLYASGRAGPAKVPARTGHYEGSQLQQETRNKVMTPAQFERYRQEQEMSRNKHEVVASDESEEDEDDEDEAERNRQLAKERRKQEAHLAVYRQQMMKVTGEQPGTSHMHLGLERAAVSTPNLANGVGKQSDDEDEDVPLGILAAHGFPNKNRPPTQLLSVNSSPDLTANGQMGAHPPAPGSMGGESAAGGARKSLPVFARNLPQDPYFGASLVNPPNRESLAFGNNGGGSVHGGGQSGLPPGGLVGVIAGEERARAARRGSPNAQGGYPVYGMPQMHQQTPGLGRNMGPLAGSPMGMGISGANGVPGMQLMMTPGDQAQVQMSQQMTQMMQMQMQWMQQMMQMQGMQNGQHIQQQLPLHQQSMMPNNPPMPPGQLQRPVTMGSNSAPTTYGTPHVHQRTMSMLDPGMSQRNQQNFSGSSYASSNHLQAPGNQAYAASIAPSERSNIGMPPRYRPVSIAPNAEINNKSSRASTLTAGTMQTLNEVRGGAAMNKAIDPRRANGTGSDDDDEEGWERMKEKRDRKKSTWKLKRGSSGLQDMFYAGSEGM